MSQRKGFVFGIVMGLFGLAIMALTWIAIAQTAGTNSYAMLGGFLLSSSLLLGLFGSRFPKTDIRSRAFTLCAIASALSGTGALFLSMAPFRHQDWVFFPLGFGSFASFQILFVYVLMKVLRGQR